MSYAKEMTMEQISEEFEILLNNAFNNKFDKNKPFAELLTAVGMYPSKFYRLFRFDIIKNLVAYAEKSLGGPRSFSVDKFGNAVYEILDNGRAETGDYDGWHPDFHMDSDFMFECMPGVIKQAYEELLTERFQEPEATESLEEEEEVSEEWMPVKGWIVDQEQRIIYHHLKKLQGYVVVFPENIPIDEIRKFWNTNMTYYSKVMMIDTKTNRVQYVDKVLYDKGFRYAPAKSKKKVYHLKGA